MDRRRGPTEKVDEDVVKADPAIRCHAQPIEHFDDGADLDVEASLLAHLADDGRIERFAELDGPAGQTPFPFERLLSAPNEQYGFAVHDDSADADDGVRRELA